MNTRIYYLKGIHCNACKILIETDLQDAFKDLEVVVSLKGKTLTLTSNKQLPSLNKINEILNKNNYIAAVTPFETENKFKNYSLSLIFSMLVVYFLSYLNSNNIINIENPSTNSSYFTFLLFGLAAGFSGCATLVGGILVTLIQNLRDRGIVKEFLLGRFISFLILGGILGLLGNSFMLSIEISAVITLVLSIIMIYLALQMLEIIGHIGGNSLITKWVLNTTKPGNSINLPFALGALTFFIPCAFTLIAQTATLNSINFLDGALKLGAFAVGTVPALAILGYTSVSISTKGNFAKIFNYFIAMLILIYAISNINGQLNVLGLPSGSDFIKLPTDITSKSTISPTTSDQNVIKIQAKGFSYLPRAITLKVGVSTRLQIYDEGVVGCARALYAPGLYPDVVYLKAGLNEIVVTPIKAGKYKISCSMGMVDPIIVTVI